MENLSIDSENGRSNLLIRLETPKLRTLEIDASSCTGFEGWEDAEDEHIAGFLEASRASIERATFRCKPLAEKTGLRILRSLPLITYLFLETRPERLLEQSRVGTKGRSLCPCLQELQISLGRWKRCNVIEDVLASRFSSTSGFRARVLLGDDSREQQIRVLRSNLDSGGWEPCRRALLTSSDGGTSVQWMDSGRDPDQILHILGVFRAALCFPRLPVF